MSPFPKRQILNSSKLKQSADDNSKLEENSRKFPKRAENTVGKGEIARYEQVLLYPRCFQKASFPQASKGVIVWEWVIAAAMVTFLYDRVENIIGKGEKGWLPAFSSFPLIFSKAISCRIV